MNETVDLCKFHSKVWAIYVEIAISGNSLPARARKLGFSTKKGKGIDLIFNDLMIMTLK